MQDELSYKNVLALCPKHSFLMGNKTQGKGEKSKRLKNVIFSVAHKREIINDKTPESN